jgi:hypothetical protein
LSNEARRRIGKVSSLSVFQLVDRRHQSSVIKVRGPCDVIGGPLPQAIFTDAISLRPIRKRPSAEGANRGLYLRELLETGLAKGKVLSAVEGNLVLQECLAYGTSRRVDQSVRLLGPSFFGCLHKVFKRSIRVDARTGLFGMIPAGSVFHKGRVKGPERARSRLDRVDDTLLILIEKGAVSARNASDIEPAKSLFAVECDKGFDGQAEEIGNLFDFLRLKKNAPSPCSLSRSHSKLHSQAKSV